jgi:hypothetical protein
MIERPFFLVGAERSGTTLCRLLLDHHPSVACYFEFEFCVDYIDDDGRFPAVTFMRELFTQPLYRTWVKETTYSDADSYPEMMDRILASKRDRDGKKLIGATVHRHFDRLLHIWPQADFIHIIRDGRDVARSRIAMGWDGNAWTAIDEWVEVESLWDVMQERLDPARYHQIHYEDLVADPVSVLSGICDFLGVEYSDMMMEYSEKSTYSKPDPNLLYQWRHKASPYQIQLMEYKALDLLMRRDYEASQLERIEVTRSEARKLERSSLWGKRRFRLRRLGLRLTLLDIISRRLPSKMFRRWVEEQLNTVRLRHLK